MVNTCPEQQRINWGEDVKSFMKVALQWFNYANWFLHADMLLKSKIGLVIKWVGSGTYT